MRAGRSAKRLEFRLPTIFDRFRELEKRAETKLPPPATRPKSRYGAALSDLDRINNHILPKVQLKLTGVLSHITVIRIQPVCERMPETAQQPGAERATAAGCFVSFRLAERYGGEESRQSRIWYGRRRIGCYRSEAVVY